jgi:hypothetical protein
VLATGSAEFGRPLCARSSGRHWRGAREGAEKCGEEVRRGCECGVLLLCCVVL